MLPMLFSIECTVHYGMAKQMKVKIKSIFYFIFSFIFAYHCCISNMDGSKYVVNDFFFPSQIDKHFIQNT